MVALLMACLFFFVILVRMLNYISKSTCENCVRPSFMATLWEMDSGHLKAPAQGGSPHESHILAGYYGLNANISFTFQAIKNLCAHPAYLCFGPFCKFFGDF